MRRAVARSSSLNWKSAKVCTQIFSYRYVHTKGGKVYIVNPATEQEKALDITFDTKETISTKFKQAEKSQVEWSSPANFSKRKEILSTFANLLGQESTLNEGSALLTEDMGKPLQQGVNEMKGSVARIKFFLENVDEAMKDDVVRSSESGEPLEIIKREPLGVIANISAWNYPYFVGLNVLAPALLTGNAVLYKPSEYVLQTGLYLVDLLHKSGVPKDVLIPILGTGEIGSALLDQPIDGAFFTGSVATGQKIHSQVAQRMLKVQLELGGKDPTYVHDDVDVAAAAEALSDGAFYNAGQSCCSVERIYVHEKIYDQFVDEFVKQVKGFKVGSPTVSGTYIGPLAREPQLSVLEDQVKDAVKLGGKLLVGGKRFDKSTFKTGYYFEPTVITNTSHKMKLMTEESFGPIIGIQKVKDENQAVELMNDTVYGLTAGVYTKDQDRANRVLSKVKSGSVYWNCCDRVSPRLPWLGRRLSGVGLTLSKEGITAFTTPKAWHLNYPKN